MHRLNRRPNRSRPRHVPRLEPLEAREVLSTCVVNSLGDAGFGLAADHGDLRFCLSQSNASSGEDLIIFSVKGTINLTKALPDISDDLIIAGPGADQLTVRRDTGGDYRIFTVDKGVTAQIYSLTVSGGLSPYGGGINNDGTLTVSECFIQDNTAGHTGGKGGGIYNDGDLLVHRTLVLANHADQKYESQGGGIFNAADGIATAFESSVVGNVTEGDAPFWFGKGGGIYNAGMFTLSSSTVSGNTAYTVDYYGVDYQVSGGGVYNTGTLTVENSTIAANHAHGEGDGLYDGGCAAFGGGVTNLGTATLSFSMVARNTSECHSNYGYVVNVGGGIFSGAGTLEMRDTVVAGNSIAGGGWGSDGADFYGALAASAYNLFGTSSGGSGYAPTDLLNVDAKLGPLQDNGGPTQTMALLPGSPAIDSGDNTNAPQWDQRGAGYPRIVNGTIDRGAFEVQNSAGPVGGSSTLVTAPHGAAALRVPQPAPAERPYGQPVAIPAPVAAPGAVRKPAAPILHAGHLPAVADADANPLSLGW
jgi:hypothetical protein